MIRNYFIIALRQLTARKANAFVNIAALTIGFAAFLMIFLIIQYEKSFDGFHEHKEQLYRVVRIGKDPVNPEYRMGVPVPVTEALRQEFPQLKNVTAIAGDFDVQVIVAKADGTRLKKIKEKNGFYFAQPSFLDMFNFGLAAGEYKESLKLPNTALLTKEYAVKFFGDWQTAIGKTLNMDGQIIKVAGILSDPPANTDFPMKGVLSYETMRSYMNFTNWSMINDVNNCYIQLAENTDPHQFVRLLGPFMQRHNSDAGYTLDLQPLSTIHFDERYGNLSGHVFNYDLMLALQLIGLFLLIIACVNFINLATAQAVTRAKEVGVRKVLGGSRRQLLIQFLSETAITCFVSIIGAALLVALLLPFVKTLLPVEIPATVLYSAPSLLRMGIAWVTITVLAGFYPALVLSGFNPVSVLKGTIGIPRTSGVSFRRVLVVFQFVIAQALIIATLVVTTQMDYFRKADMGFNKKAIISLSYLNDSTGIEKMNTVQHEILQIRGVKKISFSSSTPVSGGFYTELRTQANHNREPDMLVNLKYVDTAFFSTYHLSLLAGRIYYPSDSAREYIVNETAVKKMGIPSPGAAIGKLIRVNGVQRPIVGVVKDFHENSLRDPIGTIVMTTQKRDYGIMSVQIDLAQASQTIAGIEKTWNNFFPDVTFDYSFIEQDIAHFYEKENQLSVLYKIFAGIAIFISCLGLYGLISFMAIQRRKEIGIRKVLGAPVKDIVIMLSREFTFLILIAFLIAAPIASYGMYQWLQQYAYHIGLGYGFFMLTIAGSLLIAWATVGYTAVKAASANPVKSLRTE